MLESKPLRHNRKAPEVSLNNRKSFTRLVVDTPAKTLMINTSIPSPHKGNNAGHQDNRQLAKENLTFFLTHLFMGPIPYLISNSFCVWQHFRRTSLCFSEPRMELLAFKFSKNIQNANQTTQNYMYS